MNLTNALSREKLGQSTLFYYPSSLAYIINNKIGFQQ